MVELKDIEAAREAVYEVAHETPLFHSVALSEFFGGEIYLKAECLQRTGSFKTRGAANKLASLTADERARGVIAASAGNHAQGVAVASRAYGVKATVVMPERAPLAKVQACRSFGAEVLLHGNDLADASERAKALAGERGLVLIPGYDDPYIVAGQGTLGLELVEQCPEAEQVIVPVGGGGLIAGVAVALAALRPGAMVIGVQAKAAPGATLSMEAGQIIRQTSAPTLADGTAVVAPGALPFELMQRYVKTMVTVDEEAIAQAIVLLLERAKLLVEGAGALGIAAILSGAIDVKNKKTVVVLSGGNIDINVLAAIVQHGLLHANRYLTLTIDLDDRPGTLSRLLALIAATGANVLEVDHIRQGIQLPVRAVEIRLLLETRDAEHIEELTQRLIADGYVLTASEATSRSFRPSGWKSGAHVK